MVGMDDDSKARSPGALRVANQRADECRGVLGNRQHLGLLAGVVRATSRSSRPREKVRWQVGALGYRMRNRALPGPAGLDDCGRTALAERGSRLAGVGVDGEVTDVVVSQRELLVAV